jgi:hypothetical protein
MTKLFVLLAAPVLLCAQSIRLDDLSRLELRGVSAEKAQYKGSASLRLTEKGTPGQGEAFAVVTGASIHNGTIEVDVAGSPAHGVAEGARGFIGVLFRMAEGGRKFELLYIRPTNGRATDQLRRNHSTQYVSFPDWPWERLRKDTPGVYESYADMVSGEWTHLRMVIAGTEASFYVGSASQPCLLIHDLKLGDSTGGIGLWIGPGTDGYFRSLVVKGQ